MKRVFWMLMLASMAVTNVTVFAAEEAAEVMAAPEATLVPILAKLGVLAIDILGPLLVAVVSWAAWKVAKKFGVDLGAKEQEIVKGYTKQAINATERWARNHAEFPTSKEKLAKAVDYVNTFMTSSGLKVKSADYIAGLIEAQLEWDEKS